jgi:four helix bundle protein
MKDDVERLRQRLKTFALRILRLCESLPRGLAANVIAHQLVRAGTSPGAQYREAVRSRSDAELVSKFESILQELDECTYWFELLVDSEIISATRLEALQHEADELIAIFVTAVKSLKARRSR